MNENVRSTPKTVSSRSWDIFVPMLCFVIGAMGLVLAWDEGFWSRFDGQESTGTAVGFLHRREGTVRQKVGKSLVWRDVVASRSSVATGDSIYTGNDGSAEVSLGSSGSIDLDPDSLIVISAAEKTEDASYWKAWFVDKAPALDVVKGKVKLNLTDNAKTIRLKVSGKVYQVDNRKKAGALAIEVRETAGKTAVRLEAGAGSAISVKEENANPEKSKPVELSEGKSLAVDEKGKTTVGVFPWRMLTPTQTSIIYEKGTEKADVKFTWQSIARPDGVASAVLEVDGEDDVEQVVDAASGNKILNLSPGEYKWRLIAKLNDGDELSGSWKSFQIVSLVPPIAEDPSDRATIDAGENAEALTRFRWDRAHDLLKTVVEVQGRDGSPVNTLIKAEEQAELKLALGRYRWRLRSKAQTGEESESTPWREVSVVTDFKKETPIAEVAPTPMPKPVVRVPPKPKPVPKLIAPVKTEVAPTRMPAEAGKPKHRERRNADVIYP